MSDEVYRAFLLKPYVTKRVDELLSIAEKNAYEFFHTTLLPAHLLLAMTASKNSEAYTILEQMHIIPEDIIWKTGIEMFPGQSPRPYELVYDPSLIDLLHAASSFAELRLKGSSATTADILYVMMHHPSTATILTDAHINIGRLERILRSRIGNFCVKSFQR